MKAIKLITDGSGTRKCTLPHPEADHVIVAGTCPKCNSESFKAKGYGMHPSTDDQAWEADARALCCDAYVGTLRVEMNTLFGVREDEAVLRGRVRIY